MISPSYVDQVDMAVSAIVCIIAAIGLVLALVSYRRNRPDKTVSGPSFDEWYAQYEQKMLKKYNERRDKG